MVPTLADIKEDAAKKLDEVSAQINELYNAHPELAGKKPTELQASIDELRKKLEPLEVALALRAKGKFYQDLSQ